jgi:hypothetical protein
METGYVIMMHSGNETLPAWWSGETPVTYLDKALAEEEVRENNKEVYEQFDDFVEEDLEWVEECYIFEDKNGDTYIKLLDGRIFGKHNYPFK